MLHALVYFPFSEQFGLHKAKIVDRVSGHSLV